MSTASAQMIKASSLDITVTQMERTGIYIVSGKDAPALHAKLAQLPPEAQNLVVGELKNGTFTLQKPASDTAPTTTGTAE